MLLLALGGGFALLAAAGTPGGARGAAARLRAACSRPATVVASTLLDTAAPPGTVTEAFAVMVMGIVAGTALGNALGGAIVEGWSYEAGALWPARSRRWAAPRSRRRGGRTLTRPARA